jgi:hypothetical protein
MHYVLFHHVQMTINHTVWSISDADAACVLDCVQGNVRGLLGSLQMVLWEDSGWKPIGMGDLLEPAQVRWGC